MLFWRLSNAAGETCNTADEIVQSCQGVCSSPGQHCTVSWATLHSLPGSNAQSPQQYCTVSLAVLHNLPAALYSLSGGIAQSPRQRCIVSLNVLHSLPGSIPQSPVQCCWGDYAVLPWRLQCFCGDCAMLLGRLAMLPGRLCNAVMETVQCCWGDCAMLLGRLCNPAG